MEIIPVLNSKLNEENTRNEESKKYKGLTEVIYIEDTYERNEIFGAMPCLCKVSLNSSAPFFPLVLIRYKNL